MFIKFRGRKGEGGRERENHRLVAFHRHPDQGSNPPPRYVPWPGIEPATFWCLRWCFSQLSHPARVHSSLGFNTESIPVACGVFLSLTFCCYNFGYIYETLFYFLMSPGSLCRKAVSCRTTKNPGDFGVLVTCCSAVLYHVLRALVCSLWGTLGNL